MIMISLVNHIVNIKLMNEKLPKNYSKIVVNNNNIIYPYMEMQFIYL